MLVQVFIHRRRRIVVFFAMLLVLLASQARPTPAQTSPLSAVWANNGQDKVAQHERRATNNPASVYNSVWNGERVSIFGARNEVVAFNLILEAADTAASDVAVRFDTLTGPDGFSIQTQSTGPESITSWVNRPIELFYVRYLEIKGLSLLMYDPDYDERHVPERMRRPWTGEGEGTGTWEDRPDHNAFYPDIAVPLELVPTFDIAAGQNQSIWVDIYIPQAAPAGLYSGIVTIIASGQTAHQIPVELQVRDFTLPDVPNAQTMLYLEVEGVNMRYFGEEWMDREGPLWPDVVQVYDRHFMLAHRHRIALIGAEDWAWDEFVDQPRPEWLPRLDGSLFTAANGYDGPGVGAGNGVYSIGTYGGWEWQESGQAAMWQHGDAWVQWFDTNAPDTEYFLYLIDESDDFPQTEQWAQWLNANPGPGSRLMSFATTPAPDAAANTPSLDIVASWADYGLASEWEPAVDLYRNDPARRWYVYNGWRPASGTFATEDDGVAPRQIAWAQYKMGIDRWFFWSATYYNNYQGNTGQTNVFQTAQTFGGNDGVDSILGETGWNYSNGDGLLMYPGTDLVYPEESYGVMMPFASLRLKFWRRGIQDVDYLVMAAAIDPERTAAIVSELIPAVLWEVGVTDPADPTWVLADISWPVDPDRWEAARVELADIIEGE